ncbi:MAG: hypothetical protein OEV60_04885 [Actinomycetota bacterium]|nr:hypothetical protein [Actinomycetota bacterium]
MEIALRVVSVAVGVGLIGAAVISAVKTVVIPRQAASVITRTVFTVLRRTYHLVTPPSMSYERRDRVLATYAPIGMLALLATWIGLAFLGYAALFWGLDGDTSGVVALELSGSSLFTLGFLRPGGFWLMMVSFTEAAIGLFLLALLITYLPNINAAFSRRERGVTALSVRAGEPPSGTEMVLRFWRLERMSELHEVWIEWERWFVDVEETHTSFSALAFFRSPQADHSWVTASGAVLDAAALASSSIDIPHDVQADICIRAGYLSLRRIAEGFGIAYDRQPEPDDPISITRQEWDDAMDDLAAAGVEIKADRDQAWRDFAGWRVNYDTVLLELADLTGAPYAMWSSDRGVLREPR